MRSSSLIYGVVLLLTTVSLVAKNIAWNNASGGVWSDKNNWQPKQVPVAGDTVDITKTGNYTVTLDTNASASSFLLGAGDATTQTFAFNGQTLSLAGPATVSSDGLMDLSSGTFNGDTNSSGVVFTGTMTCSGGTLAGRFTITTNSVLNLAATNALSGLVLFTNQGTVNWSNIDLYGGSGLQIFNAGFWIAQSGNAFYGSGMVFNNSGTLSKSAGVGTTMLDTNATFNSSGIVNVQSGELKIYTRGSGSGTFNLNSNALLTFQPSLFQNPEIPDFYTLTGSPSFLGTGMVQGGVSGSNAVINSTLILNHATLSGSITFGSNAIVTLAPAGQQMKFARLSLTNYGEVDWYDVPVAATTTNVQIYNYGLWEARTNSTFSGYFNANITNRTPFNNYGILRKSGGAGTTLLDTNTTFNSSGLVDVQSGELQFYSGVSGGGTFNVNSNALLTFNLSPFPLGNTNFYVLTGSAFFSGAGLVQGVLGGSSAVINGSLTLNHVTLSGSLTFGSNATVTLVSAGQQMKLYQLSLTNYGEMDWYDVPVAATSTNVQIYNYGLWDNRANGTLYFYGYSNANLTNNTPFNNYGTFRKSGGTGVTLIDNNTAFNNFGTVDVQSGQLQLYSGVSGGGAFNVDSNAVLNFNLSAFPLGNTNFYVLAGNVFFSGAGLVEGIFGGSNAVINGSLILSQPSLTGSMTIASNAVVTLAPAGYVSFARLSLTNYGEVDWYDVTVTATTPNVQIYNYGLWDNKANSTFSGYFNANLTNNTSFNNYGIFRKSGGTLATSPNFTTLDQNMTFNNHGTVDVLSGALMIYFGVNSGSNNVAAGTTLYSSGFTFAGDVTFSGSGAVNGSVMGSNAVIHGVMRSGLGTWSGAFTVATNALVNFLHSASGQFVNLNSLLLTNYGTIVWSNLDFNLAVSSAAQIFNYGFWDVKTDNAFYGQNGTIFNNFGTFLKSGGANVPGTGRTYFDSNTTFNNPGTINIQTGQLNFGGGRNLAGGRLNFGLNGPADYGMLSLSGSNGLAGALSVNYNNGFSPVAGNSFALIDGSTNGTFTGMSLPPLASGLIWRTNLVANVFTLSVSNMPPFTLTTGSVAQGGGAFSFSFEAVVGQAYQVQWTTNLAPANWMDLGSPITATNTAMTVSDLTTTNPRGFYRIRLWP